jgi:serine/threonine protein kinase
MNLVKLGCNYYIFNKFLHTTTRGIKIMLYKKMNIKIGTYPCVEFSCIENMKPYKEIVIKQNNISNGKNELKYLLQFKNNKNYVKYIGHYKNDFDMYLVTKYYPKGSLNNYINTIDFDTLTNIFNKIRIILEELSIEGLNHGDIKESNILLNNKMNPIINDLESIHDKNLPSKIITKKYSIPMGVNVCDKDLWSLGVIMYTARYKEKGKINQIENFILESIYNVSR